MRVLAALAAWVVLVAVPIAAAGEPSKADLAWKALTDIIEAPAVSVAPAPPRDHDDDWDRPGPPRLRPIDGLSQKIIAAADAYLAVVPGQHGNRIARARFLRANIRRRFDHLEAALPDFAAIIDEERSDELAVYSVNLLLDSLIRLERYDEMIVWVRKLRADTALMDRSEDLAERLALIEAQWNRKDAERHEAAAKKGGDASEYLACAASYDRVLAIAPHAYNAEEIHYNAAVCLQEGGDRDGALARYRRIVAEHPRTKLAARALLRSGLLHADAGNLRAAALAYEEYVRRWPGERDVKDARREARRLRLELFATSAVLVSLRRVSILVAP